MTGFFVFMIACLSFAIQPLVETVAVGGLTGLCETNR